MNHRVRIILAAVFFFSMLQMPLAAQVERVGVFNSRKGFGIALERKVDKLSYNTFTIFADMYGRYMTDEGHCGVKLNFTHSHILQGWQKGDSEIYIFAGAGATAGYVHEFGFPPEQYLPMCALSGKAGVFAALPGKIDLSLSFTGEAGICLDSDSGTLHIYAEGLQSTIWPELTIYFRF
ncbi:MAG: hypothetical protein KBS55_05660 [Bacteroidales bacterium]|nr:hypothetical protein [Candidatus Cryptobacteroides aphodequi]